MANNRLSMRKITETLRLHYECGRTYREISRAIGASPTTVGDYVRRAKAAGLNYPLPEGLDDSALELRLFPPIVPADVVRSEPDWVWVHREMRKKSVTLELLWQEYKAAHPEGYQYSWFCERYRQWAGKLSVTLRQTHTPGEKLFVDYAGQTLPIIDGQTGEIRYAQLFVAVLGASNYTFAEATWTQQLSDWTGSHVRAFEFIGGVPEILVPDNLKSGVKHPSYYDPELNPTYRDLASHYGVTVLPARSRKPRDKAKVENGVLVVERWILARLRNQRFFSLTEANRAISALLTDLNQRPFKKLPGCRHSVFVELDRPALNALPVDRYQFAEWKIARVGIDYHVEIVGHYYSVPYRFARQQVDVRFTALTVEIFHRGSRIAAHARSLHQGRHTTIDAHMTPAHQQVAGWNAKRLLDWAQKIGPNTHATVESMLGSRRHPQQSYRACLGVLRMGRDYSDPRLEAACSRALSLNAANYRSVSSILKHGLDKQSQTETAQTSLPLTHSTVRGPGYYH
ncbi:MAG: IS21 family transposase [Gallionella sp.]